MSGGVDKVATVWEEEQVVAYLQAHPDFLSNYPELLRDLVVPHPVGKAVSMVEYQVSVLRDQSNELRRKMHELVQNARENEELGQRIHRLTLSLLECPSVDEIFAVLYQVLKDEFHADMVALRLFADAAAVSDQGLGEFLGGQAQAKASFQPILDAAQPVCGRIKREHIEVLFPSADADIGSGALVPLSATRGSGILAIGSSDVRRFQTGIGTLFLRQLGEIVARVINPHLASS